VYQLVSLRDADIPLDGNYSSPFQARLEELSELAVVRSDSNNKLDRPLELLGLLAVCLEVPLLEVNR
jgi:hypothetical protein